MKIHIHLVINRTIQILLFYLFVGNFSYGLFAPIFAVFITDTIKGASLSTVGFAIAIYSVFKSIIQIPVARFLDRRKGEKDDFHTMLIGSALSIVYVFSLIFITRPWHLYAFGILSGISDGLVMAAYYSIFSNHIDKNSQAFEWSMLSVGGLTISVALGGALGGILAETIGFHKLFLIAGICNSVATLVLLLLYPHLKSKAKSHHA